MIISKLSNSYLANPVSFAFALLNEAAIKPTIQGIKDDWNKGLEEDFEIIYKPKGLEACKAFSKNRNINSPIKFIDIFTPTLQKLLKNEFLSYNEMKDYNDKIRESGTIKSAKQSILHTVFYKPEKNKYGLNDDIFINCIFINDQIVNKIDFIVFSWGTNIYDKTERYLKTPISYDHFKNNFYGYIKMK